MRIDQYLVANNYYESRNKAQDAISKGAIKVNGIIAKKPSMDILDTDTIEIVFESMEYVSRGGYKLKKAIEEFNLDFKDSIVLDIGSSTGGFTDCALQHGASLVYAVDVGSNQLHNTLRKDSRVISIENMNILEFNTDVHFNYLVMDVSFVSISHILPAILRYLDDTNILVCLIKPQFEAGKMIGKGVIKNPKIHLEVISNVNRYLNEAGLYINQITVSPIKGGSGNTEFICTVSKKKSNPINFKSVVDSAA